MSDRRSNQRFELTKHEKEQGLWLRLRAHLEWRLAEARLKNDSPQRGKRETALVRGEIRELRHLISLGDDRPPPIVSDEEQP